MIRKSAIFVTVTLVATLGLTGCIRKTQPGALKISSTPNTTVYVDGQEVGNAGPNSSYSNEKLEAGEVTIKLASDDPNLQPWEGLVDINPGVVTVVNRDLATNAAQAAGEQLTMTATNQSAASMAVASSPDGAMVKLDGEPKGPTPLEINQISEGDHIVEISAPGYNARTISVNAINGYKVMIDAQLAKQEVEMIIEDTEATDSADLEDTDTTDTTDSDTDKDTAIKPGTPGTVTIQDTPTGWLRVRAEATVNSEEVAKVNPGEEYKLLDEQNGWYQIELEDGKEGWISGTYADKN